MPKKGTKKNSKVSRVDSDVEFILDTKKETMFGDAKAVRGISPEFKWWELYLMIQEQDIPNIGLKEMVLYQNIKRSCITKDAT